MNIEKRKIIYTIISLMFISNAYAQDMKVEKINTNQGIGQEITYAPGAANLNGDKTINGTASKKGAPIDINAKGIPTNIAPPESKPNGLPSDSNSVNVSNSSNMSSKNREQTDTTDATINILNTSDEKIRQINRDINNKGKVIFERANIMPKVDNDIIKASLEPNSVSPVIRVSKNRTTTITMTDMTGQPWPIVNYDGLNGEDFTVKRLDNPAPEGYVLSITPKNEFVSGNLVLILKGLITPISVDFVSNQRIIDGAKQVRVQARGPNTQYTSIELPDAINTTLLNILQGVAPQGFKSLQTSSNAVQAWKGTDGSMYIRTRYKIMSPAFENVTSSADGTYAYKLVPVSVVLYKVADDRFGQFTVEGL